MTYTNHIILFACDVHFFFSMLKPYNQPDRSFRPAAVAMTLHRFATSAGSTPFLRSSKQLRRFIEDNNFKMNLANMSKYIRVQGHGMIWFML